VPINPKNSRNITTYEINELSNLYSVSKSDLKMYWRMWEILHLPKNIKGLNQT
jgi:hypothetical protein